MYRIKVENRPNILHLNVERHERIIYAKLTFYYRSIH